MVTTNQALMTRALLYRAVQHYIALHHLVVQLSHSFFKSLLACGSFSLVSHCWLLAMLADPRSVGVRRFFSENTGIWVATPQNTCLGA